MHCLGDDVFAKHYDSLGFLTKIEHNEEEMLSYDYVDALNTYNNYLEKVTYANGQTENYTYNENTTTVSYKKNEEDTNADNYVYNYDNVNRLTSSSYTKNGTTLNYNYGDLSSTTESTLSITGLTYGAQYTTNYNDVLGRVISSNDKFTLNNVDTTFNYTYGYNYRGQVTSNSVGTYNSNITHDSLERLNGYVAKNGTSTVIDNTYVYDSYIGEDGVTYTTNRIKQITDNVYGKTSQSTYDLNGYINYLKYNDINYNYYYDAMGRLTSEIINNKPYIYMYDDNTTTGKKNLLTTVKISNKETSYDYDSLGRVLTITTEGNVSHFRYDDMGNPVLYKGTYSSATDNMVWTQGRKLESGTLNGNNFAYEYDMNGMRYQKTVNGNVTEYYLDGTSIIAENRKVGGTNNLIYYIYDMNGLSGMVYNGENYYYVKNTLGDIIAIRNSAGTEVASYNYDGWGNVIAKYGTMADINPFRYRGYYYDTETGFYYLQTRYYDPTTRLFINADNYELISTLSKTPGQLNMYGYCNNNPIMFTDESGESLVLLLLAAFAFGTGISIINQGIENGWDNINLLQAGVDGLFSAISVGLAYAGIGFGMAIAASTGLSVGQYSISALAFGTEFSAEGLAVSVFSGLFSGVVCGAGAKNAKNIASALFKSTNSTVVNSISGMRRLTNSVAFSNTVEMLFSSSVTKIYSILLGSVAHRAFNEALHI